ncbi:MAG: hypothetical protein JOY85_19770 [Acidobacteriaceae bacterium]|nr:hypothetical protein [Acidobacteriaceae bacterium]
MFTVRACVWVLFLAVPLAAQWTLHNPRDISSVDRILDGEEGSKLNCKAWTYHPFLDFTFRFEAGYVVRCSLAQFEGKETTLTTYTRVRPVGGTAVILGDRFQVPAIPEEIRSNFKWKHFHDEAEFSGVFAAGEGEYQVDLAVVDNSQRAFRKNWRVKIVPHGKESKTPLAIKPYTAASTALPPWGGHREGTASNLRISVLLDAVPVFPFALKLRAWDRAFLLSSLASLVREINAGSTRVIAFNLDQQRVIFRDENFHHGSFRKLVEALQNLELGTVSYKNLQRQTGWLEVLLKLLSEEGNAADSPDAIIFLGPTNRIMQKVPREYLQSCQGLEGRIFYFEYFPWLGAEFPDAIHQIINTCRGNIYKIHNAAEFAEAIEKMQRKIQGDDAESSRTQ